MAYIRKIIGQDEQLHGIARLHWIYVLQGMLWFLLLAGGGWLLNMLVMRVGMTIGSSIDNAALPYALMRISNGAMWFMVIGGIAVFFFMVLKVLVTEIGLSNRRVMHKTGLVFVKVHQVDVEEIRGENLSLGNFGRLLGYGYINLDCRFIGDVALPAIENPERFLKALHVARSKSQDSLSVVLGKGNPAPLKVGNETDQQQPEIPAPQTPQPEIQPPQPGPEINPPSTPQPEIAPQPVPHGPPPEQPSQPSPTPAPTTPQPQQPVEAPPPSEPPLQPGTTQTNLQAAAAPVPGQALDPSVVRQVVEQAMPQMAQQVAQELARQGLVGQPAAEQHAHAVDNDLIASFDEAALDDNRPPSHERKNPLEHSVH